MTDPAITGHHDRIIRFGGQEIALGGFALLLMLIAILVPTVMYSVNLRQPTPAQLLVAIGIGMFASVLYLWVLDATSTIRFRAEWISRSVYGAAIASILGTSVGVYKDAFGHDQNPFGGEWLITVREASGKTLVPQRPVSLTYSRATGAYWGYGASPEQGGEAHVWVEVVAFDPDQSRLEARVRDLKGLDEVVSVHLSELQPRTRFSSDGESGAKFAIQLYRRN